MKAYYIPFLLLLSLPFRAQQIGNAGFENWDNLGSNQEEPTNWSSFKTELAVLQLLPPSKLKDLAL